MRRAGCGQENDYRRNQRRIAVIRYLGELYNFRMVDSSVVFDTLYLLINFGHERGRADPEKGSPLDAPDDFFRIRLVRSRYKVALAGSNATDAMLLVWHHWARA